MPIELKLHPAADLANQVVEQVKEAVLRNEVRPGDDLPSARQLANDLGVDPAAVETAYQRLQTDAVVDRTLRRRLRVRRGARPLLRRERDRAEKTRELRDVQRLQQALLPIDPPNCRDFDVAAGMITASEVGGDLYDFEVDAPSEITVVLADAAGHGARAGALATATKGMLSLTHDVRDLEARLCQLDEAFRRMRVRHGSVALQIGRFASTEVVVASAGMPPPMIYRAELGTVEEIPVSGTPLGSPLRSRYAAHSAPLGPDDLVLMTSDGFPELRTETSEPLGYEGARRAFADAAKSGEDPLDALLEAVERTVDGNPEDDVTLVTVRRRPLR